MEHNFTNKIINILNKNFGTLAIKIFNESQLLQYINLKTRSANSNSKSRSSFGNLYAIYVLLEDYILKDFDKNNQYSKYEGAKFVNLLDRQRKLPFGNKLQNHALNHRMNQEFKNFFPTCDYIPILRDSLTSRYWINENLILIKLNEKEYNLASTILQIIEEYIKNKKESFELFIYTCNEIKKIYTDNPKDVKNFIVNLLSSNTDARIFEIISYAILKYYFFKQEVYFGFNINNLTKEKLILYKTGRTNANDGGIDFVMKPLGRFFQVTETLEFKKYFLDIDKIEKYPITFVIKTNDSIKKIKEKIKINAIKSYSIDSIVNKYMNCIEEIYNIPRLIDILDIVINSKYLEQLLDEIIKQSKIEFNFDYEY